MKNTQNHNGKGSRLSLSAAVLVVALALGVALPSVVRYVRQQLHVALDAEKSAWRDREFEKVKNGDRNAFVMDLQMLSMLANDHDCVDHVESLHFDMVEITPHDAKNVSKLKNLKFVSFYDSRGAEFVLSNSHDLPIETFFFHQAELSHDALRSLADFPELNAVWFHQVMDSDKKKLLKSLPSQITVGMGYPPEDQTSLGRRDEQTDAVEP